MLTWARVCCAGTEQAWMRRRYIQRGWRWRGLEGRSCDGKGRRRIDNEGAIQKGARACLQARAKDYEGGKGKRGTGAPCCRSKMSISELARPSARRCDCLCTLTCARARASTGVVSRIRPKPPEIVAPCGKSYGTQGGNQKPCVFPRSRPQIYPKSRSKRRRGLGWMRDSTRRARPRGTSGYVSSSSAMMFFVRRSALLRSRGLRWYHKGYPPSLLNITRDRPSSPLNITRDRPPSPFHITRDNPPSLLIYTRDCPPPQLLLLGFGHV